MKKTIQSKVADTILQKPIEIEIGEKTYTVAPVSAATLIEVSALASRMPQVVLNLSLEERINEVLRVARHCAIEGDILAMLILGAGNTIETKTIKTKRFFGLITKEQEITVDLQAALAKEILFMPPSEIKNKTIGLLTSFGKEISDFFVLTTSLIEINLTNPTREVVEMTASGR